MTSVTDRRSGVGEPNGETTMPTQELEDFEIVELPVASQEDFDNSMIAMHPCRTTIDAD